MREKVHEVVFGVISNALCIYDLERRLDIAREIPGYVQNLLDNAQRILSVSGTADKDRLKDLILQQTAKHIVSDVVSRARDEVQEKESRRHTANEIVTTAICSAWTKVLSFGLDKIEEHKESVIWSFAKEDISEKLAECAKHIMTAAILSALRNGEETAVARHLAVEAVNAAKASLERLYGTRFEITNEEQQDTQEAFQSFDDCAKYLTAQAIITATRSVEKTITKDDYLVIVARSLASNAVASAKASLEKFHELEIADENEVWADSSNLPLDRSARSSAPRVNLLAGTQLLESNYSDRAAQSLAKDAIQQAIASLEDLFATKIDFEDNDDITARKIAASAVISVTGSEFERGKVDLTSAAKGLAGSVVDSVRASIDGLSVSKPQLDATEQFENLLEQAAKDVAEIAVDLTTRSLERLATKREWNLISTTRKLVKDVLDSAKASLEKLCGIQMESKERITFLSQEPLHPYWNAEEYEEELKLAARVLALDALESTTASLERLQSAANNMETTIKATAFEISQKLVDSSGHFSRQLEKEGLGIAARHLAYRAIESAANSLSKLYNNEVSLEDIVGSDSRLLQSAGKVATLSARTSLGQLFDRGFVGGEELEEATGYFATHALVSAETMLKKVKDSPTWDLDLEICKAASELASQAILSAEGSLNRLVKFDVPESTEQGKDYGQHNGCRGTLFWKVTMYVEGLVNKALRHLGTKGSNKISNEDPDKYEMITHDQAREAVAEYGEKENYLYQREILDLNASRIVNLVVENVCKMVKAQRKDNTFVSINRLRLGHAQSSDNSVEERFPDRETYTPTSEFKTCGADTTVKSQENEQLGKGLCTPSSYVECGKVHSPTNDVVKQPSTEHPASSSNSVAARLTCGPSTDLEASLSEKESVYDIIKKREGRASCDISPCGSYVILPHLNPSECSLIASRVESYETIWGQKNAVSSVTNLPSLSPKGSFAASNIIEQVGEQQEPQSLPVASSSRLPNISSSTSKINPSSAVNRSPCDLRRTSSEVVKRSIPKPFIKISKESLGLKSSPGRDLQSPCGSTGKILPSSPSSLRTKEATPQRGSKTAVFEKYSPRVEPHWQHIAATKKRISPKTSLIKASMSTSFDKRSSFKSSSETKLKQHSHPSLLYGRSSMEKGVTTQATHKGETSASAKSSLDDMLPGSPEKAFVSSRSSKGQIGTPQRASKEQVILSTKDPIEQVSHSQGDACTTTVKARSSPSSSKGSVTRPSTENAALHPRGSKAKMLQSPHGSKEDAIVSPKVSGGNIMQSPRGSFESAVKATSPRLSKEKVTLSRDIPETKNTQPQHASSEHKAFSSTLPKEVITHLVAKSDSSLSLRLTLCVPGEKKGSFHESTEAVSSCDTSAEGTAEALRSLEKVPSKLSVKIASGPEAVVGKDEIDGQFLSTTGKPEEEVSLASHHLDEISKNSPKGEQGAVSSSDASQIQNDMPELDRPTVNMDTPSDDANPAKDVTGNKSLKKIYPSLERAVLDKRLTPEGAEAETRPASSFPNVLKQRMMPGQDARQKSTSLLSEKAEKIKESERLQSSLSKTFSPGEEYATEQGSSPKGMMLAETRDEEFHSSRKKPEGKEMPETHGGPYLVGGNIVPEKEEKDKESCDKMSHALISQMKGVSHSNQESMRSTRSVEDAQSFQAYRKYGVSRSVHDTLDDIVQKMLSSTDEPSVAEAPPSTGRGSLGEIKRDSDSNFGGPGRLTRERRLPDRQISNTIMETMDFMLQTLSSSDEKGPRRGSSGSDIQACCGGELNFLPEKTFPFLIEMNNLH